MILAAYHDSRFPGEAFYGTALSGAGAVENLQQSLRSLAQTAGWTDVNPGPFVSGVVSDQTLRAVVAALRRGAINEIRDLTTRTGIMAGVLGALQSETARAYAKTLITSYATQLDVAVRALAMKMATQPPPPTTTPTPANFSHLTSFQAKAAPPTSTTPSSAVPKPWYKDAKVVVPVVAGAGALGALAFFFLR